MKQYFHRHLDELYGQSETRQFFLLSIEHFFGLTNADLIKNEQQRISESEILQLRNVVKKLKKHYPIQYILGNAHFDGLLLKVNEHTLIPRPETEELVHWIIESVEISGNYRIVDLATGSGCIALSLANHLPNAEFSGFDVSKEALEVAQINADKYELNVDFFQVDLLKDDINIDGKIDVIVSNPPYVRLSEKTLMQRNVVDHEPELALFVSDNDPLLFYDRISDIGLKNLKSGGMLFFEINEQYANEVNELLLTKGYGQVEIRKDINGKFRMIKCVR